LTGEVVYAEREVTIEKHNIQDVTIEVQDEEGKIRGTSGTVCNVNILPLCERAGSIRAKLSSYDVGVATFDRKGQDTSLHTNIKIGQDEGSFIIYGQLDGKVLLEITLDGSEFFNKQFKKQYIIDVVEATPTRITLESDISEIRTHNDIVNLTVTNDTGAVFYTIGNLTSKVSVKSANGGKVGRKGINGKADSIYFEYNSDNVKTQTWGLDTGSVTLVAEMKMFGGNTIYTSNPIEIDITFADEETPNPILESSTGEYRITEGGGQLVLTPVPGYSWYGGYTFSKMSVDGGNCSISTSTINGMDVCTVTATTNGTVRIKATPTYGPEVSVDILITGQSPENVTLSVDTNTTQVEVGKSLIVRAKPSNNPASTNYRFRWDYQTLDTTASVSTSVKDSNTAYQITGKVAGKILVRCLDYTTYALLDTIEIEVI
jgi:hypothetical protein